eukprot:112215_1
MDGSKLSADTPYTLSWCSQSSILTLIDQRALPGEVRFEKCRTPEEVAENITVMTVRGAPAIGATGAFGMVLAAQKSSATEIPDFLNGLGEAKLLLDAARPTAVNLEWATGRLLKLAKSMAEKNRSISEIKSQLETEAQQLFDEDIVINKRMAKHGATVVRQGANILHHCNTGSLATVHYGTAIGVIYECHNQGKGIHVWVDETRPRLQGARLTAWELMQAGVPMHLIADNAAGSLMRAGKVDVILFGADRVAANGDVANKIGTYQISVLGRENGVAVYAVVPTSTIDLNISTGDEIPIEERSAEEVVCIGNRPIAPEGVRVFNPAFDVTPNKYLTGIITEEGICYPPFEMSLRAAKIRAEERISLEQKLRAEKGE